MTNTIIHAAIHDLIKGDDGFRVQMGNGALTVTSTAQRVIDELYALYSRRASKSHGKFSTAPDAAPTEGHLRAYADGQFEDFNTLTGSLMETLKHQAGLRNAAQGGHVFFAHFEREGRHYLLVVIVNDKLGAALTNNYNVADVQHLDIEGFRFAGRVNLTAWAAGAERYVGFLKGKGVVSEYFKAFLGCDTTVQDRQDTTDLVRTLKQFAQDQGMAGEAKDDFLNRAKTICSRAARNRTELDFETLANELTPEAPDVLLKVLTDPDLLLNDRFVPDGRALNGLVRFRGKTALWSVEFDREALTSNRVRFDPTENSLTLVGLPDDLAAQLRNEFSADA
jgi:nucleoid-associated protein